MADLQEDKGFKAGFNCLCAKAFAKGVPLLNDYYDLDHMKISEIPTSTVLAQEVDGDIQAKEVIQDKSFLFSSMDEDLPVDLRDFILNLEFKSGKRRSDFYQAGDQYAAIYTGYLRGMVNEKRASGKSSGSEYYKLMREDDIFPDIYTFVINTSETPWLNNDWEVRATRWAMLAQSSPGRRYIGSVDVMLLDEWRINRFGVEARFVFRLVQTRGNGSKVKKVIQDYKNEFAVLDSSTTLLCMSIVGAQYIGILEELLESGYFGFKEGLAGMFELYFNTVENQYYADLINQEKAKTEQAEEKAKLAKQEAEQAEEKAKLAKQEAEQAKEKEKLAKQETHESVAINMLKAGEPVSKIMKFTSLPETRIRELADQLN